MNKIKVVGGLLAGLALAGCAGGGSDATPTPTRAEVVFEDEVRAIDPKRLVGRWECRELNPFTGLKPVAQTVTYETGGKARSQALVNLADQGGPDIGPMASDSTFDWRVEGERLLVSNIRTGIRAANGNPGTGLMAGLAQTMANTLSNRGGPATSNVLRLNDRELVMRDTETPEAPLFGCTRAAAAPPG